MSKKRRVFDINFDDATPDVPAGTDPTPEVETRRGPMAAAITENADALNDRAEAEVAIRNENDALAHEHVRLKKAGLITDLLPLDSILMNKLTRDRAAGRDPEIDDLKRSIQEVGLSNPIRVEKIGDTYELIQGFRRLSAFRELYDDTGDEAFARIPAGINAVGEDLLILYRRMVDENLVRRGVSFAEMAQLAFDYAGDVDDFDRAYNAIDDLYASVGRQKRSYIKQFLRLLSHVGPYIKHPEAMPRQVGINLMKIIDEDEGQKGVIAEMLTASPGRDAEVEQQIIAGFLKQGPAPKVAPPKEHFPGSVAGVAKTTFRLDRPEGVAKCTVSDGRIELRLDRDFNDVERGRLEAAVASFLDALDH